MQTSMKRGIFPDPFKCKPEMAFFKVTFLFQMMYLRYFMNEIKYVIFKSAVLLANEHQSDQTIMLQMISV